VDQQSHKWTRVETFSGKLTENLVQATARDCLRDAMIALDAAGFDIRAHIHDEVIISEPIGGRGVPDVAEIMGRTPSWAPGLPLRGDGYACDFYMKD
jgi:DNA polymerase